MIAHPPPPLHKNKEWSKALTDWEFDDEGALTARLDELIAAAPEADSDSDDEDEDSDDEDSSD